MNSVQQLQQQLNLVPGIETILQGPIKVTSTEEVWYLNISCYGDFVAFIDWYPDANNFGFTAGNNEGFGLTAPDEMLDSLEETVKRVKEEIYERA